jgi:hypothetical protein
MQMQRMVVACLEIHFPATAWRDLGKLSEVPDCTGKN